MRVLVSALLLTVALGATNAAGQREMGLDAANILAPEVRMVGQPCEEPQSAEKDEAASTRLVEVWVLRCKNASYRVRLAGDTGPEVERLGDQH